ncbi:MAG: CinA family protein [Bdellovibrionales bacterium]
MQNPLQEKILELQSICLERGWHIGLAESCTGGLLSAWLAQVPGISSIYQGSVVSYSRQVKIDILGVKPSTIKALGEVSQPVALAMAQGARKALHCDWSVAITGIAGPSGGSLEKPVGMVCFGVAGPGFEKSLTHLFPPGLERHEIQRQAALFAFDLLLSGLR